MKKVATQIKKSTGTVTVVLVLPMAPSRTSLLALTTHCPPSSGEQHRPIVDQCPEPPPVEGSISDILKAAPQFLLENPIALQKKYIKLKDDPSMKKRRPDLGTIMKDGEQGALEMLVEPFAWLDGLELQPTLEIVPLYMTSKNNNDMIMDTFAPMDQVAVKGLAHPLRNTSTSAS